MTINSISTIVVDRILPSPPPNGQPLSKPKISAAPEYPFKGWQPPQLDGYRHSAGTPTESAIIIDNGAGTLKAGYSFDKKPRFLIPPLVAKYRDRKYNKACNFVGYDVYADATTRGQIRNAFEQHTSVPSNWDVMEGVLDYVFLKLGVDGASGTIGRPVVMTEPVANLGYTRRMMNEILFECYGAPSVSYGIDSLFSYRYNKGSSGLVVSSSHTSTHIIPVMDGKSQLQSCARLNWGGSQAQEFMMKLLRLKYPTFPGKMTIEQMEEYIKRYCYLSADYSAELSHFLDWSGLEQQRDVVIQYPFTEQIVVEKSAEDLARIAERKKESGRRLQEQAARMRLEKLVKKEQELEYYQRLRETLLTANKKEQRRLLDDEELKDETALERIIRDLDKSIRKSRNKDLGAPEEEEKLEEQLAKFPLIDIPDDQLTEDKLKEKRHQRLMKSGVEARIRAKAEKERERTRVAEEERRDVEKRENQFEKWVEGRRAHRDELLARIKEQARLKADSGNRKGMASQMRMKTLANLAADGPKRKRRGGGEYDDDFGANDDDWGVYRTVATDPASDDEEVEEDPLAALKALEAELLRFDPEFSEKDTIEAQNDWTKSTMHAFLRGARPFDPESQREANQIHLNVERIRVPEVIFQPGIAGVDQAGLIEIIEGIIMSRFSDQTQRKALLKDVFLTGGNTLFTGFEERLARELEAVLPTDLSATVRRAQDPVLDAWRGAASWWSTGGRGERETATVTRTEYLERGSDYVKEHSLGNSLAPPSSFSV